MVSDPVPKKRGESYRQAIAAEIPSSLIGEGAGTRFLRSGNIRKTNNREPLRFRGRGEA
jgi:hypothetical protein